MKRKILIIIPIIVLLSIILSIVFVVKNKNKNEYTMNSYLFVTYQENGKDYACITFYQDGDYSLYDCDSEPTNYPFDSEWNCTYSFDNKNGVISFSCPDSRDTSIKVVRWTEKEFSFEYEGEKKTFIAIEKND